jgi:hypothetical protein
MKTRYLLLLPLAALALCGSQISGGGSGGTGAKTWTGTQTFTVANSYSITKNIVAHAGGGQGSCTALTTEYNVLGTVATQLDSVCIPSAAAAFRVTIYNAGANAACVYPQSGQTIGTMPANACDLLPPGSQKTYFSISSTGVEIEPFYRGNTSAEAYVFEDFDTSEISTVVYSLGWSRATAGSGANPAVAATSDAGRLGIVLFSTSTSATGASGLWTHSSGVKLGGAYIEIEWSCMFPTLGVTAQQYAAHIGSGDASTAEFGNGLYFRYSNSANGDIWEAVAANSSTRTRKTTGSIAVAANTWYRLKIAVNPAGTRADYWVNDTYLDNITTNISTGTFASNMANIVKSNGTTASTMNCDWAKYYKRFTTAR